MTVSKRLRFEILRRDNHACRYCGRNADEIPMTIDHVVPVALGGSDEPTNLVAACKDCNAGKSSVPVGAALVDDVAADALRWSVAMQVAYEEKLDELHAAKVFIADFREIWDGWTSGVMKRPIPRPDDWDRSISIWYAQGVPLELLRDAVRIAMRKVGYQTYGEYPEWSYMCGVVWKMLAEVQTTAAASLEVPAGVITEPPFETFQYLALSAVCDGI